MFYWSLTNTWAYCWQTFGATHRSWNRFHQIYLCIINFTERTNMVYCVESRAKAQFKANFKCGNWVCSLKYCGPRRSNEGYNMRCTVGGYFLILLRDIMWASDIRVATTCMNRVASDSFKQTLRLIARLLVLTIHTQYAFDASAYPKKMHSNALASSFLRFALSMCAKPFAPNTRKLLRSGFLPKRFNGDFRVSRWSGMLLMV